MVFNLYINKLTLGGNSVFHLSLLPQTFISANDLIDWMENTVHSYRPNSYRYSFYTKAAFRPGYVLRNVKTLFVMKNGGASKLVTIGTYGADTNGRLFTNGNASSYVEIAQSNDSLTSNLVSDLDGEVELETLNSTIVDNTIANARLRLYIAERAPILNLETLEYAKLDTVAGNYELPLTFTFAIVKKS